ncbi:hypothetical protein ACFE04_006097 [Oxalis oulophora]
MSSPLSSPWNNQINRALETDPLVSADQVVTPPPAVVASPPSHTVWRKRDWRMGVAPTKLLASSTKSASLDSLKGIAVEISLQVSASQKFKSLLLNFIELKQENAAFSFAEITSSSKISGFFHSVSVSL